MTGSDNPDKRIADLLRTIREDVRIKRERAKQSPADGVLFPPPHSREVQASMTELDEALARAERVEGIGVVLPPMTRQRGIKRLVAEQIARAVLRIAQIITRDQREFNHDLLVALRAMRRLVGRQETELAELEADLAERIPNVLAARQSLAAQDARLEELQKDILPIQQEVQLGLDAHEASAVNLRASVLSIEASLARQEAEVARLRRDALRPEDFSFEDSASPGHVPQVRPKPTEEIQAMVSYAQNREDVLLRRLFAGRTSGFYIDVGAADPTIHSVTKHFYDQGWRGVNVEPASEFFRQLCAARARDINLNCGVSDSEGTLTFHESSQKGNGLSTFSSAVADAHRRAGHTFVERVCPVTTLARICEEYLDCEIDFISIDVEEHEREVIQGGDWRRWRPKVVVVEATWPSTTIPTHERWESLLLEADYIFATFDGLNRYYVRAENQDMVPLLQVHVNVFDRYVPYEYLTQIEKLRARLAECEHRNEGTRQPS